MTTLLTQVFDKVSNLPLPLQDQIALTWNEELESELIWSKTLESSSGQLEKMAEKALLEHNMGKTYKMGFDE